MCMHMSCNEAVKMTRLHAAVLAVSRAVLGSTHAKHRSHDGEYTVYVSWAVPPRLPLPTPA